MKRDEKKNQEEKISPCKRHHLWQERLLQALSAVFLGLYRVSDPCVSFFRGESQYAASAICAWRMEKGRTWYFYQYCAVRNFIDWSRLYLFWAFKKDQRLLDGFSIWRAFMAARFLRI